MGRTDTGTPARLPDEEGFVERDGVRICWERYGSGEPTVLLLPTWSIVHSRHWKAQIGYLARHLRVITFDGRGSGRSDRPSETAAYRDAEIVADAIAVLDAVGCERVVLAGISCGGRYALHLAARHPERVLGAFVIGPSLRILSPPLEARSEHSFDDPLDTDEGWAKHNRHYWLRDFEGWARFFCGEMLPEPHSTKQLDDMVAWALDTTAETLLLTECDPGYDDRAGAEELVRAVRCPVVVAHGTDDRIVPVEVGRRVAELTGGELIELPGEGHIPQARHPIPINLRLRAFAESLAETSPARPRSRARSRRPRALMVSSPIGLGHARRDLAIVAALRRRVPNLEVDWLAQPPVTDAVLAAGERVHPASAELSSECDHIEAEAGEHELDAFGAIRRMDDILCANFGVFLDAARDGAYDLWIGDEAWDVDHYLHEHPELKTARYAWLTDFVGWLPLPGDDARRRELTADWNAELIGHIEGAPAVRDVALFVGDREDVVPGTFGPGLPEIGGWVERHHDFVGQIAGFDAAAALAGRAAVRDELGLAAEDELCVVAVGGSAVGLPLLERIIACLPELRERHPRLELAVVRGPRIASGAALAADGLRVLDYVPDLPRLLAACDVALVAGGLTTGMELVALGRPFVGFPLRGHFEQRIHVRHRLDRHGARHWIEYADATPTAIAAALEAALARPPAYLPVSVDGAARAAARIAPLLIPA